MTEQPHNLYDEAPIDTPRANEPVTPYQAATRRAVEASPMTAEMEEWLRPMTMADIHRRIDEAESEIVAGRVMTSQQVFAEMERKYPWLCE